MVLVQNGRQIRCSDALYRPAVDVRHASDRKEPVVRSSIIAKPEDEDEPEDGDCKVKLDSGNPKVKLTVREDGLLLLEGRNTDRIAAELGLK